MNPATVTAIFERLQTANPAPHTALTYSSAFELLIAVILSAQATDTSVNRATAALFSVANTPEQIARLGEAGLIPYIKTIGLYRSKARHIIKTCGYLIERYQGGVPGERARLQELPGVGRKTANVVLNTVFGQPTIAVDTHVFRVSRRLNLAQGKTPLAVEQQLTALIPERFKPRAHHWLVFHGRLICRARKPHCAGCCLRDLCPYPAKTA